MISKIKCKHFCAPVFCRNMERWLTFTIWLSAFSLVISANTFFGQLEGMAGIFLLALNVCSFFIIAVSYKEKRVTDHYLRLCSRWMACVLIPYAVISAYSLSTGGMGVLLFFIFLSLAPLLIKSLISLKLIGRYFRAYINVITLFAICSLVLWCIGPMLNIVAPNVSIENNWSISGETLETPGWYNLLYAIQPIDIFGVTLHRNTGIFVEAPMYSFTLCLGFAAELLCFKKPRIPIVLLFVVTVLTTFSITGYIVVALVLICKFINWLYGQKNYRKFGKALCTVILVFGIVLVYVLFQGKMATPSGNTRLDDFIAGFLAWSNNFIFGNGFNGYDSIVERMSSFRLHNTGFSNSPFLILAEGGIVLAFPYLLGIAALFYLKPFNLKLFSVSFLLLWTITVVPFIPVTALVFGMAIAGQIENETFIYRKLESNNAKYRGKH